MDFLAEVNRFNVRARYPDYKFRFYKIANRFKKHKDWDKNERYLWRKACRIDPRIEPVGYSPEEFKNDWIPLVAEIKENGIRIV